MKGVGGMIADTNGGEGTGKNYHTTDYDDDVFSAHLPPDESRRSL